MCLQRCGGNSAGSRKLALPRPGERAGEVCKGGGRQEVGVLSLQGLGRSGPRHSTGFSPKPQEQKEQLLRNRASGATDSKQLDHRKGPDLIQRPVAESGR